MPQKFLLVPLSDLAELDLDVQCPVTAHAARVVKVMNFSVGICPDCNDAEGKMAYRYLEQIRTNIEWLKTHKWEVSLRMPLP